MQNFHRKTYGVLAVLLIVTGTIFSGCAARENAPMPSGKVDAKMVPRIGIKNASMEQLIFTPDPYLGSTVEISGEVYDIENFAKSTIVRLTDPNIAELLECEFSMGKPPPTDLKAGQQVTVIGKIDIIKDVVFLRKCHIK